METFIVISPVVAAGWHSVCEITGEDAFERAKAVAQALANRDGKCVVYKAEKVLELQKETNFKESS